MENKPNRSLFKIITAALILLLVVVFALQNSTTEIVKLWFWEFSSPLVILFFICFVAGLLFALLGIVPIYKHSKRKSKLIEELKERIDLLEKENTRLK